MDPLPAGADDRAPTAGSSRRRYLQEMVYRVLQAEQYERLLEIAAAQQNHDPVARVIAYLQENLAEPVTVADLAEQVGDEPVGVHRAFPGGARESPLTSS